MESGFETIGNATLICHDRVPVLVTDPWLTGSAYFGSWTLSHEIPEEQMAAIKRSQFVWISHGHPDHLSPASLQLLKDKKILLPDHAGGKIFNYLRNHGYDVCTLKDRVWMTLSEHIKILNIADFNQDAVLLADINGRLIVNINDAIGPSSVCWLDFVIKTAERYKISFLLALSGFDANMINFFKEDGSQILPAAAQKKLPGQNIAHLTKSLRTRYFIPFSSMHRYQRKDSAWANEYITPLKDYAIGFQSKTAEIFPAFIRYDCVNDKVEEIKPPEKIITLKDPEYFKDRWEDPLEKSDIAKLKKYFRAISHLRDFLNFINVRAGGKDNVIMLTQKRFDRGITFEVPRHSLMLAVEREVFDNLLIGNFMKTTLHGKWKTKSENCLYPDFSPYVGKYADGGGAKSKKELARYFGEYKQRILPGILHQLKPVKNEY